MTRVREDVGLRWCIGAILAGMKLKDVVMRVDLFAYLVDYRLRIDFQIGREGSEISGRAVESRLCRNKLTLKIFAQSSNIRDEGENVRMPTGNQKARRSQGQNLLHNCF